MPVAVDNFIPVGLGDVRLGRDDAVLMALGLGSCVGVALYDPVLRAGGMAHIVLPAPLDGGASTSGKFATAAIPRLLDGMLRMGAERRRLVCKIAGGAQVLAMGVRSDSFKIGERNIAAVHAALTAANLRPVSADTGGTMGRSFRLTVGSGAVAVKRLGEDWREM